MDEDDRIRGWLGLTDDERLVCERVADPPSNDVALGRSLERDEPHELLAAVRAQPDLTVAAGSNDWVRARFWDHEPGVVVLDVAAAARSVGDVLSLGEGAWLLDGRRRPAWLATEDAGGTIVVRLDAGGLRWLRVRSVDEVPHEPPTPEGDDSVSAWIGEDQAQGWLVAAAEAHAAPGDAFGLAVAAGLVARLWSPPSGAATRDAIARRLAGGDTPLTRARRWAARQPAATWTEVERHALDEAAACTRAIVTLCDAVPADRAVACAALRDIVRRRDDLECAAFALRAAGRGQAVARSLTTLDDTAASRLDALVWIGLDEDGRVAEVAWQEPAAWWGLLGRP